VTWAGVLDIDGRRYPLKRGRTVIGRGTDAEITVNDSSISRKHIEILWDGSRAQANDLGSTNGSWLNGRKLTSSALESGATIEMGATRVTFHLVPQAANP
jgi:pSer/pThr/pTyr-binding forkhead associated (FHA) protein